MCKNSRDCLFATKRNQYLKTKNLLFSYNIRQFFHSLPTEGIGIEAPVPYMLGNKKGQANGRGGTKIRTDSDTIVHMKTGHVGRLKLARNRHMCDRN